MGNPIKVFSASWEDVLADVREVFGKDPRVTRERVKAYLFGKYGFRCKDGGARSGARSSSEDIVITPLGTPQRMSITSERGRSEFALIEVRSGQGFEAAHEE